MSTRKSERPGLKIGVRRPTALDRQIGALIRERRAVLAMRQEDLARLLGITPHQLQKYEVGENRIAASRLVECARALAVPVVWFYQTGGPGQRAPVNADASISAEEQELIQSYHNLSPEGRTQLIAFAKVMQNSGVRAKSKSRAP